MANRNRTAGHNWERIIVNLLNSFKAVPEVGTARELSQYYDNKKIDIVTRIIQEMDEFGLAIQAKNTTAKAAYPKLLDEIKTSLKELKLEEALPVIFHNQTKKVGNRFMPRGQYACLYLKDFLKIFVKIHRYKQGFKLLEKYFDLIPEKDQIELDIELKKLDL